MLAFKSVVILFWITVFPLIFQVIPKWGESPEPEEVDFGCQTHKSFTLQMEILAQLHHQPLINLLAYRCPTDTSSSRGMVVQEEVEAGQVLLEVPDLAVFQGHHLATAMIREKYLFAVSPVARVITDCLYEENWLDKFGTLSESFPPLAEGTGYAQMKTRLETESQAVYTHLKSLPEFDDVTDVRLKSLAQWGFIHLQTTNFKLHGVLHATPLLHLFRPSTHKEASLHVKRDAQRGVYQFYSPRKLGLQDEVFRHMPDLTDATALLFYAVWLRDNHRTLLRWKYPTDLPEETLAQLQADLAQGGCSEAIEEHSIYGPMADNEVSFYLDFGYPNGVFQCGDIFGKYLGDDEYLLKVLTSKLDVLLAANTDIRQTLATQTIVDHPLSKVREIEILAVMHVLKLAQDYLSFKRSDSKDITT